MLLWIAFWLINETQFLAWPFCRCFFTLTWFTWALSVSSRQEHNNQEKLEYYFSSADFEEKKKIILQCWHIQVNLSHKKWKSLILICCTIHGQPPHEHGLGSAKSQQKFYFSISGKDLCLHVRSPLVVSRLPWLMVQLYLQVYCGHGMVLQIRFILEIKCKEASWQVSRWLLPLCWARDSVCKLALHDCWLLPEIKLVINMILFFFRCFCWCY